MSTLQLVFKSSAVQPAGRNRPASSPPELPNFSNLWRKWSKRQNFA